MQFHYLKVQTQPYASKVERQAETTDFQSAPLALLALALYDFAWYQPHANTIPYP